MGFFLLLSVKVACWLALATTRHPDQVLDTPLWRRSLVARRSSSPSSLVVARRSSVVARRSSLVVVGRRSSSLVGRRRRRSSLVVGSGRGDALYSKGVSSPPRSLVGFLNTLTPGLLTSGQMSFRKRLGAETGCCCTEIGLSFCIPERETCGARRAEAWPSFLPPSPPSPFWNC